MAGCSRLTMLNNSCSSAQSGRVVRKIDWKPDTSKRVWEYSGKLGAIQLCNEPLQLLGLSLCKPVPQRTLGPITLPEVWSYGGDVYKINQDGLLISDHINSSSTTTIYLHCGHSVIAGFDLHESQMRWNWLHPNIGSFATCGQKLPK